MNFLNLKVKQKIKGFIYKLSYINNMANINISINKELHNEVRIMAIRKNKLIRDLLPELIQGGLDNAK